MMKHVEVTVDNKVRVTMSTLMFGDVTETLNITPDSWTTAIKRMQDTTDLIQDAFHMLTADEREFIISGCPIGNFDDIFKEEENED